MIVCMITHTNEKNDGSRNHAHWIACVPHICGKFMIFKCGCLNGNCWQRLCRQSLAITRCKCVSRQFCDPFVDAFCGENKHIVMDPFFSMSSDKLTAFIAIGVPTLLSGYHYMFCAKLRSTYHRSKYTRFLSSIIVYYMPHCTCIHLIGVL